MGQQRSISDVADQVLAEVKRVERVKVAELEAVRAATPRHKTEVGALMHKVAEELRATPVEVTYDDLAAYLGGRL